MTSRLLKPNDKLYLPVIYGVSLIVFLLVVYLGRVNKAEHIPSWAAILPMMNALLNATTCLLLLTSFYFIRKGKIELHKKLNLTACVLSALFLLSYVVFHSFGVETKYPETAPFRSLYLFILISHIILASIILPLVLVSLYRGLTLETAKHRKIVRWSFPIWLYVTISGVIVYLMIAPYYTF